MLAFHYRFKKNKCRKTLLELGFGGDLVDRACEAAAFDIDEASEILLSGMAKTYAVYAFSAPPLSIEFGSVWVPFVPLYRV